MIKSVTREEAIKFLESACRNWTRVPPLSEDDIGDVATELLRFVAKSSAPAPQIHAVGDNQPRYTTKRLHDEISKARDYGRFQAFEEVRALLEPFAIEAAKWSAAAPDDYRIKVKLDTKVLPSRLTVGDLRRVHAFVSSIGVHTPPAPAPEAREAGSE